ncbi:bacteriocin immunity protein [Superficieibacter sp.]|uniref:bacteriocin immunity protein n=1 Tax=Superficieibacter sp. TaxID=2303322 RepID=UPI0028A584C3|nr:bacteriocin immunity protein [Superficieibacter sp.]
MPLRNFSDYTEREFLDFVKRICRADYQSEQQHTAAVFEFERITEHPSGSDLFYYPESVQDSTPEKIVEIVKNWRAGNGKTALKPE